MYLQHGSQYRSTVHQLYLLCVVGANVELIVPYRLSLFLPMQLHNIGQYKRINF
jgi:hypothetical protein